jgi:PmbA protein
MNLESAIKDVAVRLEVQNLDAFEVVGLDEKLFTIEVKQQMIERMQRTARTGLSIRTIKDGCQGFAVTRDMTVKAVHQALKNALDSMESVEPSEDAVLPGVIAVSNFLEESVTQRIASVSDEVKIRTAMSLESLALASEKKVTRVQHPRYEEIDRALFVVNSNGVKNSAQRALASCELRVIAEDKGGAESSYDFGYSTSFDRLCPELVARRAARRAVAKLGAGSMAGGKMPVAFTPRAAAQMLRLLSASFCADNVQRGKSVLAGKLGERFYHPSVTVVDDGLLPDGFGSFPFDWEGVPKQRTLLVQDGVVRSWLYDGARAAHDGVTSTGSSQREDLNKLPSVGISNCFLKAGHAPPESIIAGMGKGVLVTDLFGAHTANIISGAFSLGIEGFSVCAGAVGEPIRGVTAAGNVHDLFKGIAAVGNDLEFFAKCGSPTILVDSLMIGS